MVEAVELRSVRALPADGTLQSEGALKRSVADSSAVASSADVNTSCEAAESSEPRSFDETRSARSALEEARPQLGALIKLDTCGGAVEALERRDAPLDDEPPYTMPRQGMA